MVNKLFAHSFKENVASTFLVRALISVYWLASI